MNKNTPGNRRSSSLDFLPLSSPKIKKKKGPGPREVVVYKNTIVYLPTTVVGEYCGFVSIH